MTSPPYMTMVGHPQNPLNAYQSLDGDYGRYVEEMADVFGAIARAVKPGGRLVLNVANLHTGGETTLLAADVSHAVASVSPLEEEIRIDAPIADASIESNYCYVFRNQAA